MKRKQRQLSRKKKGSKNREKAKHELGHVHDHVANQRKDHLHKVSRSLVDCYDLICMEDLQVKGMMKNHRLAKSIANAGWGRLTAYIEYKAKFAGKIAIKVPPHHTSQLCSSGCGTMVKKDLSVRIHKCPACGLDFVEPTSAMRKTIKLYAKFLDNKDRKAKLRKIGKLYQTPLSLHIDIMAVLCGLNGGSAQDVIIAVLSAGSEKETNAPLSNIEKFGNIEAFWQLVQKYTGYVNEEERSLSDLAALIFISALSQMMPASALRGLERFVSDACKAYCYQLVHEWQRGDGSEDLIEIFRHVEGELRLADRFDNIVISILLKT